MIRYDQHAKFQLERRGIAQEWGRRRRLPCCSNSTSICRRRPSVATRSIILSRHGGRRDAGAGEFGDARQVSEAFIPEYHPQEILEMAQKLYAKAR
jgi:hypothetical protein